MMMMRTYSNLISAATTKGLAHKKMGKPNQDYALVRCNSWIELVCIADGVGSHNYSQKGSKQICKSVYKSFKLLKRQKITEEQLCFCINDVFSKKLKNKYNNQTATTCIFAAIYNSKLYVAQAGDGICGVIFDGKLKTLGRRHSDFVNEVYPIKPDSSNEGKWNYRTIALDGYSRLDVFLGTDGISDDILPEKLQKFIEYIFDNATDLNMRKRNAYIKKILKSWNTPNSNDDKTIAILRWISHENN